MKKRMALRGITGLVTLLAVGAVGLVMLVLRQPQSGAAQVIDRESTRIVVNGQKIFPIGMYHTSWAGTDVQKYNALEAVGAAGFNLMHPALDLDDQKFIERAHELGVYLMIESDDAEGPEAMVEAYKDEPIVLGWLVADDFNSGQVQKSPPTIASSAQLIKSIAPHQLTYMSGNTRNLEQYVGLTDVIGIQTYSIPSDPLDLPYRMLTTTVAATAGSHESVFANLQTYIYDGRRVPTNDEIRNITYQALIAGVDGILYYTYFDEGWDIEQHQDMWLGLIKLNQEVKQLTPIVLNGQLTSIPSEHPGLLLGQWAYEGKRYLVVINPTEDTMNNITLPVTAKTATPMFAQHPAGFALQNNTLTGSIGAIQVDVYILED